MPSHKILSIILTKPNLKNGPKILDIHIFLSRFHIINLFLIAYIGKKKLQKRFFI